jgi:hypothetical protein
MRSLEHFHAEKPLVWKNAPMSLVVAGQNLSHRMFNTSASRSSSIACRNFSRGYLAPQDPQRKSTLRQAL